MKAILFLLTGVLALLGSPIFVAILALAMLGFYFGEIPLQVITIEIYRISDTPLLLALPLFTLAGYILAESNTSTRLVRMTQAMLGWMPGGLSVISFITCALFTAFTGASGVTIVAIGALVLSGRRDALSTEALTQPAGFRGASGVFRLKADGTNQRGLAIAAVIDEQMVILEPAPTSFGGS